MGKYIIAPHLQAGHEGGEAGEDVTVLELLHAPHLTTSLNDADIVKNKNKSTSEVWPHLMGDVGHGVLTFPPRLVHRVPARCQVTR